LNHYLLLIPHPPPPPGKRISLRERSIHPAVPPPINLLLITTQQRTNERKINKRFNTMTLPPQVIAATEKIETFMEKYPVLTQNGT